MKEYIAVDGISRIRGLSLFNIYYDAGHIAKLPRGTPADTLIILLRGKVRCTIPGTGELVLTPGVVTIFTKEQPRTSYYLEDTQLLSIHIETKSTVFGSPAQFRSDEIGGFGRSCLMGLSRLILGDSSDVSGSAGSESEKSFADDDFAVTAYVYGLLSELVRSVEPDVPERFAAIHSAKLAIERDFTLDRPIPDYAYDAAMSVSTFRRLFTLYVGLPPAKYRLELRLEYVKLLVSTGECNLSEAAVRAGFNSLSYLCRQFKLKYGCSVNEYLRGE